MYDHYAYATCSSCFEFTNSRKRAQMNTYLVLESEAQSVKLIGLNARVSFIA